MMGRLTDWRTVVALVASCRNDGLAVSNFFPDEERMSAWCRDGAFFGERCGDTQFFVRRQNAFVNVYFMGRSVEALGRDWKSFATSNGSGRWVVDLIGPDGIREPMENAFVSGGFDRLTTLQRMGRKTPVDLAERLADVECATVDDVRAIKCLLETYFVAEEEQIPSAEEIGKWIERQSIYVVRGNADNPILGFVILTLRPRRSICATGSRIRRRAAKASAAVCSRLCLPPGVIRSGSISGSRRTTRTQSSAISTTDSHLSP